MKQPNDSAFDAWMFTAHRPSLVFVEGRGSWLIDQDGGCFLDFVQGWAVNCLGHSPQAVVDAIARQAAKLINPSPGFYNEPALRLTRLIAQHSGLQRVFLANSGAEANEGAIKLARKWGEKHRQGAYEIITMEHGFHGRTLATMAASGKPQWRELFEPKTPGFPKAPLNDLAAVEAAIGAATVAVMLEPIQGEAGVVPAADNYLRALRTLTRDHGILLIFDEIQTGMGRTGKLFGFQHTGVTPDILTLGKGLGGGAPLAALVAREDICCFDAGDQGGTFNGNPLMAAAGCAVMDALQQPGFLEQVAEKGDDLASRLQWLSHRHHLGEVRGRGLLLAMETGAADASQVVEAALHRKLLLNAPRPSVLRFMPALTVSQEEIIRMIGLLDEILDAL